MRDRRRAQPDLEVTRTSAVHSLNGSTSILCALVLVTATLLAHGGGLRNGFVNWDDDHVLVENQAFRGFTPAHLHWMFTTSHAGHYQPLTWLSYAMDNAFWGEISPFGVHLTNLFLHVLTTLGFWLIAGELLGRSWPAAGRRDLLLGVTLAALFFAVHPFRVESVAWATERRDVLSGAWLMAALYSYLRAMRNDPSRPDGNRDEGAVRSICQGSLPNGRGSETTSATRSRIWIAASLAFYVLSLMSKAVGMTLPVILLLMDIYPLRRWPGREAPQRKRIIGTRVGEKIPFLIPAVTAALLAAWAQRDAGAMWEVGQHSWSLRLAQAFYGIAFYIIKTLWPVGLIPLYEQPTDTQPFDLPYVVALCAVVVFTIIVIIKKRRFAGLAAAWAAYLVLVSPMLGLAQSGPQVVADRYSYISGMPFAMLAGAALVVLRTKGDREKTALGRATIVTTVTIIGLLIVLSRRQTAVWADSYSLWTHTLAVAPQTGVAHGNLASILNQRGDHAAAREHSWSALEILPGNRVAHLTLARAAVGLGDPATAEKHYEIGLTIRPDDPGPMISLAGVKLDLGKLDEAEKICRRLIELEPQSPKWPLMLATVLSRAERDAEAIVPLQRSLQLDPRQVEPRLRLATLLIRAGDAPAALAVGEEGIRMSPRDVRLTAHLAWLLATVTIDPLRDGPRALDLARQAVTIDPTYPAAQEALAAALAETGDLLAAIDVLEKARTDARLPLGESLLRRWEEHLQVLHSGHPLRQ